MPHVSNSRPSPLTTVSRVTFVKASCRARSCAFCMTLSKWLLRMLRLPSGNVAFQLKIPVGSFFTRHLAMLYLQFDDIVVLYLELRECVVVITVVLRV